MKAKNVIKGISFIFTIAIAPILPEFSYTAKGETNSGCGCDHIIPLSQKTVNPKSLEKPLEPGHVICLESGDREWLHFDNIKGTKEKPITIKNCGGAVTIKNTVRNGVISFNDNVHFRFTGTGDPAIKYGINVVKGGIDTAIRLGGGCSDFEIDHIEVGDAGFAGIMIKSDPNCNLPQYQRQNFLMENVRVHDNYIHDVYGEGFYIGHHAYNGLDATCGKIYPHLIKNLKLYNNIVRDTGADGIQVACAPEGTEIYNNIIENYGKDPFAQWQDNGLIVGNQALVYNNFIKDGKGIGAGIQVFGGGGIKVFNNIVVNSGNMGIFCDERTEVVGDYFFINNTIINSKDWGIRLYGDQVPKNHVKNNIIVSESGKYVMKLNKDVIVDESNNLYEADISKVLFEDPSKDNYKLKEGSPAIDAGADVSGLMISFDFNKSPRPYNGKYDIGAHEHGSLVTSVEFDKISPKREIILYPNPTEKQHVTIVVNKHISDIKNVMIYDIQGNLVAENMLPNVIESHLTRYSLEENKIDHFSKSMYVIRVETKQGYFSEKLIIK